MATVDPATAEPSAVPPAYPMEAPSPAEPADDVEPEPEDSGSMPSSSSDLEKPDETVAAADTAATRPGQLQQPRAPGGQALSLASRLVVVVYQTREMVQAIVRLSGAHLLETAKRMADKIVDRIAHNGAAEEALAPAEFESLHKVLRALESVSFFTHMAEPTPDGIAAVAILRRAAFGEDAPRHAVDSLVDLLDLAPIGKVRLFRHYCLSLLRRATTPNNAFAMLRLGRAISCQELEEAAVLTCIANFSLAVKRDRLHFLQMDLVPLTMLLSNSHLVAANELEVWQAVADWVQVDLPRRKAHLRDLLTAGVHLHDMDALQLGTLQRHPLLSEPGPVSAMVSAAYSTKMLSNVHHSRNSHPGGTGLVPSAAAGGQQAARGGSAAPAGGAAGSQAGAQQGGIPPSQVALKKLIGGLQARAAASKAKHQSQGGNGNGNGNDNKRPPSTTPSPPPEPASSAEAAAVAACGSACASMGQGAAAADSASGAPTGTAAGERASTPPPDQSRHRGDTLPAHSNALANGAAQGGTTAAGSGPAGGTGPAGGAGTGTFMAGDEGAAASFPSAVTVIPASLAPAAAQGNPMALALASALAQAAKQGITRLPTINTANLPPHLQQALLAHPQVQQALRAAQLAQQQQGVQAGSAGGANGSRVAAAAAKLVAAATGQGQGAVALPSMAGLPAAAIVLPLAPPQQPSAAGNVAGIGGNASASAAVAPAGGPTNKLPLNPQQLLQLFAALQNAGQNGQQPAQIQQQLQQLSQLVSKHIAAAGPQAPPLLLALQALLVRQGHAPAEPVAVPQPPQQTASSGELGAQQQQQPSTTSAQVATPPPADSTALLVNGPTPAPPSPQQQPTAGPVPPQETATPPAAAAGTAPPEPAVEPAAPMEVDSDLGPHAGAAATGSMKEACQGTAQQDVPACADEPEAKRVKVQ